MPGRDLTRRLPRGDAGARPRGQALVEFAIVALVLFVVFLAFADIGFGLLNGQVAVESARIAGREAQATANVGNLASFASEVPGVGPEDYGRVDPLNAAWSSTAEVGDFDRLIFRRRFAAIQVDPVEPGLDLNWDTNPNDGKLEGAELDLLFESLPPGNRALRPAMRRQLVDFDPGGAPDLRWVLRLPGTLMRRSDVQDGTQILTVWAPEVTAEDDSGNVTVFLRELVQVETPDARGQFTTRVNLIHTFLDVLVLPKTFAGTFSMANLTSTGEPTPVGTFTASNEVAFADARAGVNVWTRLDDGLGTILTRTVTARPERVLLRGATVARAESP